jgi:hypothetical protein
MAHKPLVGQLPCLFCNRTFHGADALTVHLDTEHQDWVDVVLERLGLPSPAKYPIVEYRRALAEAFAAGDMAPAGS